METGKYEPNGQNKIKISVVVVKWGCTIRAADGLAIALFHIVVLARVLGSRYFLVTYFWMLSLAYHVRRTTYVVSSVLVTKVAHLSVAEGPIERPRDA